MILTICFLRYIIIHVPSVIEELVSRFDKLVDTGDGSYIPADLISITYLIVCISLYLRIYQLTSITLVLGS